jgi:thiol-disulfide isomerase/thioredoxin
MHIRTALLSLMLLVAPVVGADEAAPDFTLPGQSGPVTLADLRGKVVYLDFWASWCGPCRQSFPWMNEVQRRYGDQGLAIVAVNLDQEPELAARFIDHTKPEFTIAYDAEGAVAERYQVQGMPSSYVIDREGRLHARHVGFRDKDRAALERTLRDLLNDGAHP